MNTLKNFINNYYLNDDGKHMPRVFILFVILICVLPFILNQFGIDFSSQSLTVDPSLIQLNITDTVFNSLRGAFTHTILEWSAFSVAVFVAFLSISHYRVTGDVTTPIIGIAFFMAGCMDAFHTLAANRLINAVADNSDLIPFTWVISRVFNALIMIIGVSILLFWGKKTQAKSNFKFVIGISAVFGITAYLIIHYLATSANLPQTTFQNALLTRPYDALPLILFIASAIIVYPLLFKNFPSLFSHALVISAIPQIVTQLHMTFGSVALFDNHFNIAHFMKIVAYLIPLVGLSLDYVRSQHNLKVNTERQHAIVDNMVDGLITINNKGEIKSFNPAAEKIFDYTLSEVINKNIKFLMPDPFKNEHDGYLYNYFSTNTKKVIGKRRELKGQRKDGSIFPLELAVSEHTFGNKKTFIGIIRDITELKKIEKLKGEFIATVSHELRTPLTSIRGALSVVLGKVGKDLPYKIQRMLETANRNSERLTYLINDILDLEKLEAGKLEFEFKALDISEITQSAIDENENYARNHNVELKFINNINPNTKIWADEHRILQVYANLISNAVKFSPENSTVEIILNSYKEQIHISVCDRGPGIPDGFLSKIFQRFAQADSSDTRRTNGTGLGLTISKAIIERLAGDIGFETQINVGTEFYFNLPEWKEFVHSTESRVLICEYNPDTASSIINILEDEWLVCDVAPTLQAAKSLLTANYYKLILLDLDLHEEDGDKLLKELRENKLYSNIPIIVISGEFENYPNDHPNTTPITIVDWIKNPVNLKLCDSIKKNIT